MYSRAPLLAVTVAVVVRTAEVSHDARTVAVAYQAHDPAGRTTILAPGLSATLVLSATGELDKSRSCSLPSETSGVGTCSTSVPLSWFSDLAEVIASMDVRPAAHY